MWTLVGEKPQAWVPATEGVLPSDSRFRNDLVLLREGDVKGSQVRVAWAEVWSWWADLVGAHSYVEEQLAGPVHVQWFQCFCTAAQ